MSPARRSAAPPGWTNRERSTWRRRSRFPIGSTATSFSAMSTASGRSCASKRWERAARFASARRRTLPVTSRARALARDVTGKVRRRADAKRAALSHRFEAHDRPDAVDMAENEVAVEPIGKRERLLQVDLSRFVQPGGAAERLAGDIDPEALLSALHHGEARAVNRDAVADLDAAQAESARVDGEAQTALCRLDPADSSDGGYDSGKHGKNSTWLCPVSRRGEPGRLDVRRHNDEDRSHPNLGPRPHRDSRSRPRPHGALLRPARLCAARRPDRSGARRHPRSPVWGGA